ncbi:Ferritin-like domain-containing protein [Filimonas lacunae]|uniref:Ferritin-like domain-containing protein n=1 Tax=Filimonas lacunae TaxID=477680 RepID=A0A173MIK6_9BACT|nr:ferritin-like domain-containing protein [Filimonas lacunae]BAV07435.1 hypothetical protein FLA_3460 [Filimonas lacunae]SIT30382.1 Ferritin-like domain-containing protein [Filimonas lacunae]
MTELNPSSDEVISRSAPDSGNVSRRKFLSFAGAASGLVAVAAIACKKSGNDDNSTSVGSGDTGVLNYAYALEQLEAAFYIQVAANASFTSIFSSDEQALLTGIRDHEIAHREFFKTALSTNAIGALEVDFSSINFSNRASVLGTAKAFEDLGVSAYNGAGNLITNGDYLVLAGKIVSVEARHAAYIRDLISNGTFSDSTDANGMDTAMTPQAVVAVANGYLKTKINANGL